MSNEQTDNRPIKYIALIGFLALLIVPMTFSATIGNNGSGSLTIVNFCKLVSISSTTTCATYTTPSGATSTYSINCYVTATGAVNHGTCQITYTEANTSNAITLVLATATNTNTVYTAQDLIWVAPNTVITLSLQITTGTFNIAGNIIRES